MKKLLIILFISNSISYAELSDSLDKVYNITKEVYASTKDKISSKPKTKQELKEEQFRVTWDSVFNKYSKGAKLLEGQFSAPESAWFSKDKGDYKEKIDALVSDILTILTSQDILKYKDEIEDKKQEIKKIKEKIIHYQEKRVGAPDKSLLYTTKEGYDKKIKNAKDKLAILKNDIEIIKTHLEDSFKESGIDLSKEQIDVLLTRIDGNDIIQMSVVMKVLNNITDKILVLMQNSQEDLEQAKRYYGMHLISWQLVYYIQQKYIDKVDKEYIPKIDNLISKTKEMINQTSALVDKERDSEKRYIYKKNLGIQKETQTIAIEYKKQLLQSREDMKRAQEITSSNIKLSENLYNTVSLSSQLYSVISESQKMFTKIAKIQMPKIVPFENIQIKKKYQEITGKLLKEK